MGTDQLTTASALFGKTRRRVLSLLYGRPDEVFHARQIIRFADAGQGSVQRELKTLAGAGVLIRKARGNQVLYQANSQCPVYPELRGLIVKTAGVADVLRAAVLPLADRILAAFLFGSVARLDDVPGSDVDVLVVGRVGFGEVVDRFTEAQQTLSREVNPIVYPEDEFARRVSEGQPFLRDVLNAPKIFLLGNERELARLAEEGLAQGASPQSAGDRAAPEAR